MTDRCHEINDWVFFREGRRSEKQIRAGDQARNDADAICRSVQDHHGNRSFLQTINHRSCQFEGQDADHDSVESDQNRITCGDQLVQRFHGGVAVDSDPDARL